MGISVQIVATGPAPRYDGYGFQRAGIEVVLECDVHAEMFCRGFEKFTRDDGFVGCHTAAMAAGWLERVAPQGRIWLCPACSGKRI
jgi:hypothetical protein